MTQPLRVVWSGAHGRPCVVARATDDADVVIAACRAVGAVERFFEDRGHGDVADGEEFVVRLRDDGGPELLSEAAVRRAVGRAIA